jgi:hypothetical protein
MKAVVGGAFAMAALMTFVIARLRGLNRWLALASALAFGSSGLVLNVKDSILSDGPFLVFAGSALVMMIIVEQSGWDMRRPVVAAALVLLFILLAYGCRAVGLTLALAFALQQAIVKRRPTFFNVLVLGGFGAGVLLMARTLFDTRSYAVEFHIDPSVIVHNAVYYLRSVTTLWAGAPAAVRYVLVAFTGVLAVGGWLRRTVRKPSVLEFYVLVALLPLLPLSAGSSPRYLLPVFALYFIYFFEGVEFISQRISSGVFFRAAGCVLLLIGAAFTIHGAEKGPYPQGIGQPTFASLCAFINQRTSPDDLIVSWNPRVLALYTGRRNVWYPPSGDLTEYLHSAGADFVLVYAGNPDDVQRLAPALKREPAQFAVEFQNSDFTLYRSVGRR